MGGLRFCSLKQFINEDIYPVETVLPIKSIQTVIDNRRNVGYDQLTDKELKFLRLNNVEYIKVPRKDKLNYYIFYNDKQKALRLLEISQLHDGMLKPDSFEEAVEIGKLLGYNALSIDKYVFDKYGRHLIQQRMPVVPDVDVNDLDDY